MSKNLTKVIEDMLVKHNGETDAVIDAFAEAVESHIASQANKFARFEETVIRALTDLQGRVNLDYVTTKVATDLGGTAAEWSENKRLCADYIRANSASEQDGKPIGKNGEVLSEAPLFYLARGLGGVCLFADRLAKATSK